MKVNVKGLVFVGFAAAILAGAAHATGENIVTSQAYTEATYQHKLGGDSNGIVKAGSTAGSVTYVDIADASTDITGLTNDSSAAAKGALTTAEAVKGAIDAVNQTATNAQVKSDTDYQLGGSSGSWKTLEAGTYIAAPVQGTTTSDAKIDIASSMITSSSLLSGSSVKLVREQDAKGYADSLIGGSVNSSNTTQAPTGATIAAAIEAAHTANEQAYQPIAGSGHLLGNNGDWETLQNGVGTTISTVAATNDTPGQVKVDINTLNDGTFTNVNGADSAGQVNNGKIPTASDVKTYVDTQVSATATAHTYTADEVTVHKDSNNQFSALTGTVADSAATLTTGDQVHDYVQSQLTTGGTGGHGYQEKSTALSVGNSSGGWTNAATSVTNDATTVPTTQAVYNAIQGATGGNTIPGQNSSICGANGYAPCALVAESDGLHWRTMATDTHAGGTCGDAAGTGCNAPANP